MRKHEKMRKGTRKAEKRDGVYFLHELMNLPLAENADRCYREMLYYRGNVPSKEKDAIIPDAIIPDDIIEREVERGFEQSGRYLKRVSYLSRVTWSASERRSNHG